ncbi:hypothetical protein DFH09DRAFT_1349557 [Mycena vulgaris]|nr:hypothetical protein DFH09DRAFT_1349557 [Mycena vulgaris]
MVFALFDALEHNALLFYIGCSDLLDVTRELSQARGGHVGFVAGLFWMLKNEAFRRDDDADCGGTFDNALVCPPLRLSPEEVPSPPGYRYQGFTLAPMLLCAPEEPTQRHVWATLWEAVLRCDEERAYGKWGTEHDPQERHWFREFKDAARKIAEDESTPVLWRARFALILEELENQR